MSTQTALPKGKISYQCVTPRDTVQSLFGTNVSGQEMVDALQNIHKAGFAQIQTGGGTFFDIFAKKGRDPWKEIDTIQGHFADPDKNVKQSALMRGDASLGYDSRAYDVINGRVLEMARAGTNVIQNFNGNNQAKATAAVAEACRIAREEHGLDIVAQGTICIEDNTNVTIPTCLQFAEQLIEQGHEGFYLKSASGVVKPEFVSELVTALAKKFPNQDLHLHVHATYGHAEPCYKAAVEAAVENGANLMLDVAHPALAGNTGHVCPLEMNRIIKQDKNIAEFAPKLNESALIKDNEQLKKIRCDYTEFESTTRPKSRNIMERARAPGGASSTLAGIEGLKENLGPALYKEGIIEDPNDWDGIVDVIYEMQEKILPYIGDTTQVTPNAANTTSQASASLYSTLLGNKMFDIIAPDMLKDLLSELTPPYDKRLQAKLLKENGLEEPIKYVPAKDRAPELPAAKQMLKDAGIAEPTERQAIWLAEAREDDKERTIGRIINCANETNVPNPRPDGPIKFLEPLDRKRLSSIPGSQINHYEMTSGNAIEAIGGKAALQTIADLAVNLQILKQHIAKGITIRAHEVGNYKAQLSKLLGAIPQQMLDYGFTDFQVLNASKPKHRHNVHELIQQLCDLKGPGVYEATMKDLYPTSFYAKPKGNWQKRWERVSGFNKPKLDIRDAIEAIGGADTLDKIAEKAARIIILNEENAAGALADLWNAQDKSDGNAEDKSDNKKKKNQEGETKKEQIFHITEELLNFVESVPEKLAAQGFLPKHIDTITDNLYDTIQKHFDRKLPGLYNSTMWRVSTHKRANAPAPEQEFYTPVIAIG